MLRIRVPARSVEMEDKVFGLFLAISFMKQMKKINEIYEAYEDIGRSLARDPMEPKRSPSRSSKSWLE